MYMNKLEHLSEELREFATERDWGKFHSPKNLVMALVGELGELAEHFQWLSEEESFLIMESDQKDAVSQEISDVLLYLIRLADQLGVDLYQEALKKMELNRKKYPVEKAYGKSTKYNKL